MPTYRLDLSYDGSGFHGYARQPRLRTVQGDLEKALERIIGVPLDTVVAGRTDAGVHARNQVVSFATSEPIRPERLTRSLTKLLAPEIVVYEAAEVSEGFSARFSARRRTYRYTVLNRPFPDPLQRGYSWHVPHPLDLSGMNQALQYLVGEHDFASFCRRRPGASTVRTVQSAEWIPQSDHLLMMEITAAAFCHQMVRSIVAYTVEVGRGRVDPHSTPDVLAAQDRNQARGAAPPHGLILWQVDYGFGPWEP